MSQLILMRRRIKTIETIYKITNAMRLVAMSGHGRLKRQEVQVEAYVRQIQKLYMQVQEHLAKVGQTMVRPAHGPDTLVIVASSQKGLCGSFNGHLFDFFQAYPMPTEGEIAYVGIGKYATEFLARNHKYMVLTELPSFGLSTVATIAATVTDYIDQEKRFGHVIVVSNLLKSFFLQQPIITTVLPVGMDTPMESNSKSAGTIHDIEQTEPYIWEQDPAAVLASMEQVYIGAKLYAALFRSLLAEQAARFLSMDMATRNADGLLETSKLQYNKLRQAKITREISELVSSM